MSEKRIRGFAKETAGHYAPDGVRQLCRDLLDEQPDVVKVLKELRERRKWALAVETAGREARDINTEVAGMISAKEDERLAEWVSIHFHVRLTSNGWEWTER